MKIKFRFGFGSWLAAMLTLIYIGLPRLVLASTYGSGKYGSCAYGGTGCALAAHPGFWHKYGWLIFFGLLILIFLLLLLLLLRKWLIRTLKDVFKGRFLFVFWRRRASPSPSPSPPPLGSEPPNAWHQ